MGGSCRRRRLMRGIPNSVMVSAVEPSPQQTPCPASSCPARHPEGEARRIPTMLARTPFFGILRCALNDADSLGVSSSQKNTSSFCGDPEGRQESGGSCVASNHHLVFADETSKIKGPAEGRAFCHANFIKRLTKCLKVRFSRVKFLLSIDSQ